MEKLIALHKHWCTANSVKVRLGIPFATPSNVPAHLTALARMNSDFFATSVWYALLYVVIEGYRELSLRDQLIDELLKDEDRVGALRRFRNGLFHYQENPLGQKLLTFLENEGSHIWITNLNASFAEFFKRELTLKN